MAKSTPKGTVQILEQGYIMTRVVAAPRVRVFEAWSDPSKLAQWWGPKGFTTTFHHFDFRSGGHWDFTMHGPDGTTYANHIVFLEVAAPERIQFKHLDPDFVATVTFVDLNGQTQLAYSTRFETAADFDQVKAYAVPGGQQTLDCLEEYL